MPVGDRGAERPGQAVLSRPLCDLVLAHDFVAKNVARRFFGLDDFDDLLQIARLGVIKAALRFEPSKGASFATFAWWCARGEVEHHVRGHLHLIAVDTRKGRHQPHHVRPLDECDAAAPDPALERVETALDIRAALSRVPMREREVLGLYFINDMTQTDIARALRISQRQVNRRLRSGLRHARAA